MTTEGIVYKTDIFPAKQVEQKQKKQEPSLAPA